MKNYTPPAADCPLCPRLCAFHTQNRITYPSFFNAPVPSFGELDAALLVVGLAPGLKGANQTGRPFTGDYAGLILYSALQKYDFAQGNYQQRADDGLKLVNCRITNAVRCVPPDNKPEPSEIRACNHFLRNEINAMPNLQVILTLGQIAHKAVVTALQYKQTEYAFGHSNIHTIKRGNIPICLINSYHCSRYNINTNRLTQKMFDTVVEEAQKRLRGL